MREFRIPHDPKDTPQNYTPKVERAFLEQGLDIHRHEVDGLEDDFKKKQRILKVKNRKYFFMGA
jgi:hypothetical protein